MKNKNLTILMAEFMKLMPDNSGRFWIYDCYAKCNIEYNPFKNPAQMNAFIEHPDVMMNVTNDEGMWIADICEAGYWKGNDNHRTTAINKCTAAFFGEEFEI